MNNLIRQVTLDRSSRKKDKSVSLTFVTDLEQSSEDFMEIDKALDTGGILYYKPNGVLTQVEVDEIDNTDIELEGKTKSQRLRNVLFVYNKQNECKDFKDFYALEMERIIEHYKSKLKDE